MNKSPYRILFAGPIGCGKTRIAYYLSWNLNLPIFNNDTVREELLAERGEIDASLYLSIKEQRVQKLIASKLNFIYDASVDRFWGNDDSTYKDAGYTYFLISIDYSLEKLKQIYTNKGFTDFKQLVKTYKQHQDFLDNYGDKVGLSLKDNDFKNRLEISLHGVQKWLES